MENLEQALARAIREFRQPQYDMSCSESTLHAINDICKLELEPKALTMMAGFSGGLMSEDLCGVISASVAALGAMFTSGVAHQSPKLKAIVLEYLQEVDQYFGSRQCAAIKCTHRDQGANSCNPVIFDNATLFAKVVSRHLG